MPLEPAVFVDDLTASNPPTGDLVAQGDDHIRLIKTVLQTTFPNADREFRFPAVFRLTDDASLTSAHNNAFVTADATAETISFVLPTNPDPGYNVVIRKEDSSANVVEVSASGGIDGGSITFENKYDWGWFFYTGVSWYHVKKRFTLVAADIPEDVVTNAMLAEVPAHRILGNDTAAAANPQYLTGAEVTAELTNVVGDSGSGGTKGLVPAAPSGSAAEGKVLGAGGTFVFPTEPFALLEERKTAGTDGGNFANAAWRVRDLTNEVHDIGSFVDFSSAPSFTLPAGTYYVEWEATAYQVGAHQTRLRNVTDGSTAAEGSSEWADTGSNTTSKSVGATVMVLAGTKNFELQHQCLTTGALGFGRATNLGTTEKYASVRIWRRA